MLKVNWEDSKQRFINWWNRKGLVIGSVVPLFRPDTPEDVRAAGDYRNYNPELQYADPDGAARRERMILKAQEYPADCLPAAMTDFGPGSLAMYLGSRPEFDPEQGTVWFHPAYSTREEFPELRFDSGSGWWEKTEALYRCPAATARGTGDFLLGFPDLVENWDILASLRGAEHLLTDMIEDPVWVREKIREINSVYFEVYNRLYDMTRQINGGSIFSCFRIWSPGKCAKLQCDGSAMFSTAMFEEFVLPALLEQCTFLDHALYHLDGTQCIPHLDLLLEIPELDAVEWTPQAGIERGAHKRWHPMYRRILDAGKSVQVLIYPDDIESVPELLSEIGTEGVYLLCVLERDDFYRVLEKAEPWYG